MNIERFKGIEFVRISSMPKEQQKKIWESFEREKIIKIVSGQSLLNDCILYSDFAAWEASQPGPAPTPYSRESTTISPSVGKLAFE